MDKRPRPASAEALLDAATRAAREAVAKTAKSAGMPPVRWNVDLEAHRIGGQVESWGDEAMVAEYVEAYALAWGTEMAEETAGVLSTVAELPYGVRVEVWGIVDQAAWDAYADELHAARKNREDQA